MIMARNPAALVGKDTKTRSSRGGGLDFCVTILLLQLQGWCLAGNVQGGALQQAYLSLVFTRDVLASNALAVLSPATLTSCSVQCTRRPDCFSFALLPGPHSCWLYARYVHYQTNGTAAPGMRYYWKLQTRCPTERDYIFNLGACYKMTSINGNWNQGLEQCENEGGVLFFCDTQAKLDAFWDTGYKQIWLGASDSLVEGDWRWMNGQKVMTNWKSGEPDNFNNADYMSVAPGFFFEDSPLEDARLSLCEVPLRL